MEKPGCSSDCPEIPICGYYCKKRGRTGKENAHQKLVKAIVMCFLFLVAGIFGSIWSDSVAIIIDTAYLLTELLSFVISLLSTCLASRPETAKMPYGWHRIELVGALLSICLLWVATGISLVFTVYRIVTNDQALDERAMLITALVGIFVNIIMAWILHGNSLMNYLDNKCDCDAPNINIRAAFAYVLGDFVQSVCILIAALLINYDCRYYLADPLCTFVFFAVVVVTTVPIAKDALYILMQGAPKGLDLKDVQQSLIHIEGVLMVHNLRVWSLSLGKTVLIAHLVVKVDSDPKQVLRNSTFVMYDKYDFHEVTLQVEEFDRQMIFWNECKQPL